MEHQDITTVTRLRQTIASMLPWAHGHPLKTMGDFVAAILEPQRGCQAQLARGFDHQEAASKRLSRLRHHPRLQPGPLADAVWLQGLHPLPRQGCVRLAMARTLAGQQHLLVVSLVIRRRALPIDGRVYDASVLKGRMQRDDLAVMRRALGRVIPLARQRRLRVTAERGFADVARFDVRVEDACRAGTARRRGQAVRKNASGVSGEVGRQ